MRIIIFILLLLSVSSFAQTCNHPDGHCAEALSPLELAQIHALATPVQLSVLNDTQLPTIKPAKKDHNFWFGWNSAAIAGNVGLSLYAARELNGNRSNFTDPGYWHRHLPEAYRESLGIMATGELTAYVLHGRRFKGHHWIERAVEAGTGVALWSIARRQLRAYNQTDCDGGLTQFCR